MPSSRTRSSVRVHVVDRDGRETERQLVDDQEARRPDEHPREREHPLLTAGEVSGDLPPPFAEPREELVRPLETGARPPAGPRLRRKSSVRFSSTVRVLNTDRPSGACTIPSGAMRHGFMPGDVDPVEEHRARR